MTLILFTNCKTNIAYNKKIRHIAFRAKNIPEIIVGNVWPCTGSGLSFGASFVCLIGNLTLT